jgi:hypothetical protein
MERYHSTISMCKDAIYAVVDSDIKCKMVVLEPILRLMLVAALIEGSDAKKEDNT